MSPEQYAEIAALFPALIAPDADEVSDQVIPKGKGQKQLVMRHVINKKPVLA